MSLPDTTLRLLKVELSTKDKFQIAENIMESLKELKRIEGEMKTIKAQFKAKIEENDAKVNTLRQKYEDGYEMRNVECDIERDFESNTKKLIRLDTHEEVEKGAIPTDERQLMIGEPGPVDVEKEEEKPGQKGK